MIIQKEIIEIAHKNKVKTNTIDKDWVLGHFLNAFFSFEESKEYFVFKGGTCLRKCYIKDYRFSEDLDFTLLDEDYPIDASFIRKIAKRAEEISDIKFYFEKKKIQKSDEVEQGYEIKIKFWGADHKLTQMPLPPTRWQTFIKLDISYTEKILTEVVNKNIFHEYSDNNLITQVIPVYSINEIISEKLRSLIQRNRPRDIFDLCTLLQDLNKEYFTLIQDLLFEKCQYKNIYFTGVEDFINSEKERKNKRGWNSSLADHLPENKLPEFDEVYHSLKQSISKILNSKT